MDFDNDELDKIIREVIGAERQILYETGNSQTKRRKQVKEIIERRSKGMINNDT